MNKNNVLNIYGADIPEEEIILEKEEKINIIKYFQNLISKLKLNSVNYNFIAKKEESDINLERKINAFSVIIIEDYKQIENKNSNFISNNNIKLEKDEITKNKSSENDNINIREKINELFVFYEKRYSDIKQKI